MSWITTIDYNEADSALKRIYDRVKGPNNNVDNVLSIHSLRPHSLVGHMTLYKAVLHNANNTLPKWYLEAIGVYVSVLNQCDYCAQHHLAGLRRLWADDARTDQFWAAVNAGDVGGCFEPKHLAGIAYAQQLTVDAASVRQSDIEHLKAVGFTEGEILEVNQVACYFNYVNRMVVGLGVTTEGDVLGLSPNASEDPNDWEHR